MADTDGEDSGQNLEDPQEEVDDEALLHFGKYVEARRALPWEQWTTREKANFYMDRIFLGFLMTCLLVFLGEFVYKMWYVTNKNKVAEFVSESAVILFNWLFTQDRQEELAEL